MDGINGDGGGGVVVVGDSINSLHEYRAGMKRLIFSRRRYLHHSSLDVVPLNASNRYVYFRVQWIIR